MSYVKYVIAIAVLVMAVAIALTPPPESLVDSLAKVLYEEAARSKPVSVSACYVNATWAGPAVVYNASSNEVVVTYYVCPSWNEAYQKARLLAPKAMAMLGIILLALVYWATEAIPIPLTSVVIILLVVIFGILPLKDALAYIASDVNILVLAGLIISVALSKYEVDKYLSLKLLYLLGERADRIVLGMILSTAFISMWIPNTAAAAIMAPVAAGMLSLLGAKKGTSNLAKAMMIGVAFGATIGGIGTPVGTTPVPITISNVERATGIYIGFATWMAWGVPLVLILVLITWQLLIKVYKPEVEVVVGGRELVAQELNKIGGLTGLKRKTLLLFLVAVALWILDPVVGSYIANWTYIASLVIIIMFIAPGIGVLDWDEAASKADWGTLFLVAGGLAIGGGLRVTRISDLISRATASYLQGLNPVAMLIVVGLISGLATVVFCSITATSSAMVPVSIAIARALNLHPLVAAVVSGISSCFAFMFPASTPPNAIAYSYGYFKSSEMTKVGGPLIAISVLVSALFVVAVVPVVMGVPLTLS